MKRWSKKEELLLFKAVEKNPGNLAKAFKKVAEKLDKSERAVSQKWYNTYHNNPKNANIAYALVSKSKIYENTKTSTHKSKSADSNGSFWKDLIKLIKTHLKKSN